MKFSVKTSKWSKIETEAIVFFVTEKNWEKEIREVDEKLGKHLISYAKADNFSGSEGRLYAMPTLGKIPAKTVLLVGVGSSEKLGKDILRKIFASVIRYTKLAKKGAVALELTSEVMSQYQPTELAKLIVEGMRLGSYTFSKYKSGEQTAPSLQNVYLITSAPRVEHVTNGIADGELFADATSYARDLVNEPATLTTPAYLAQQAKKLAKLPGITVEILEKKEVEKLGMGAYLSVAQGSEQPPKFIKLEYKGGRKKVVIAGKAITFDTGGHSLKDAKNMETMKLDMAGGAAVLGVFSALPTLKPKVHVIGIIAATENMLGPNATKPGDIVKAMNGTSIEVINTDAEGRLTLADVLSYAVQEKPEAIVDLATLTGACVVALGEDIGGLFANNTELSASLLNSAKSAGEKLWPLPLEKGYRDLIKGDIADLRNIGRSRYGGAITAALFLEEFVKGIPWAHIDIAGPAYQEKDSSVVPRGGTGFGVRMLLEWLKNY